MKHHIIIPRILFHALALTGVMLALCHTASAQSPGPATEESEERAEGKIDEDGTDGSDDSELLDELEGYRRNPIDLYSTTAHALARLPGISVRDAAAILAFIDRTSPSGWSDFDTLATISKRQLLVLRDYTSLDRPEGRGPVRGLGVEIRTRVMRDLQPRRGYHDPLYRVSPRRNPTTGDSLGLDTLSIGHTYLGGPQGVMSRALISCGDISGGITFEKDPGEPLLFSDTAGYSYGRYEYADPRTSTGEHALRFGGFVSAHARVHLAPITIYAGDFSAEFGEGLVLGGAAGGSKGSGVTSSPYRAARGITSYRSAGEISFYRGGAVVLNEGAWLPAGTSASIFGSIRSLDASIDSVAGDGGESSSFISSFREDGYHRTRTEIRHDGNAREIVVGAHLQQRLAHGRIGVTAYGSRYDRPVRGSQPYDFTGDHSLMAGIDGNYSIGPATVFGEIARSTTGAIGGIGGAIAKLAGSEICIVARHLPADFYTPHGSGFGESPNRQHNEEGIYIGARAPLPAKATLSAYLDLYRSPERSFSVPFPRAGIDGYMELGYRPGRNLEITARLHRETKGDAVTLADSLGRDRRRLIDRTVTSGRLEAEYSMASGSIRLRGRIERRFVDYDGAQPSADGMITFADMRLRPLPGLSLGMRLALFATDNFDAAAYAFEQDLPGRLTDIALSGEGRRFYLFASWRPGPAIVLSAKYAETVYADRTTINPGDPQEIAGPVNNSLAVQVDLTF
ncbi:MAG: hypothetical protein JWQ98_23 [Chlorobi bacterium]|nr:hypothetical protein [Chlorobiota bacterium]